MVPTVFASVLGILEIFFGCKQGISAAGISWRFPEELYATYMMPKAAWPSLGHHTRKLVKSSTGIDQVFLESFLPHNSSHEIVKYINRDRSRSHDIARRSKELEVEFELPWSASEYDVQLLVNHLRKISKPIYVHDEHNSASRTLLQTLGYSLPKPVQSWGMTVRIRGR